MLTKDTGIIDAVQNHPEILEVFAEYGLGCVGCMASHFESIGQGAADALAVVVGQAGQRGLGGEGREHGRRRPGKETLFYNSLLADKPPFCAGVARVACSAWRIALFNPG